MLMLPWLRKLLPMFKKVKLATSLLINFGLTELARQSGTSALIDNNTNRLSPTCRAFRPLSVDRLSRMTNGLLRARYRKTLPGTFLAVPSKTGFFASRLLRLFRRLTNTLIQGAANYMHPHRQTNNHQPTRILHPSPSS